MKSNEVQKNTKAMALLHPYVIDFMKRRGMQEVLKSVSDKPEVTVIFDEKFRVKIHTFSATRITFYAAVRPLITKGPYHDSFIRQVLHTSYILFYKNRTTLSINKATGMLLISRDVISPKRSFDVEEALESFINDLDFCMEEFRHIETRSSPMAAGPALFR